MNLLPIVPTLDGNPDEDTINAFMNNIIADMDKYMDNLIDQERLGNPEIQNLRMNAVILTNYVTILRKYFENGLFDADDRFITDYNFLTVDEVLDLILKINLICDSADFIHIDNNI